MEDEFNEMSLEVILKEQKSFRKSVDTKSEKNWGHIE